MIIVDDRFADLYDEYYQEKNYQAEVNNLITVITKYNRFPHSLKVVDIACRTGDYLKYFIKHGYNVSGGDNSLKMLQIAQNKPELRGVELANWELTNLFASTVNEKAQVVLCLSEVFSTLINDNEVQMALKNMYELLDTHGILVLKFFGGLSFTSGMPMANFKRFSFGYGRDVMLFESFDSINWIDQQLFHRITAWIRSEDLKEIEEYDNIQPLRFYFPKEMKMLLEEIGFQLLDMQEYPTFHDLLPASQNIVVTARKV